MRIGCPGTVVAICPAFKVKRFALWPLSVTVRGPPIRSRPMSGLWVSMTHPFSIPMTRGFALDFEIAPGPWERP